jgi:twitching motility protein PilT
VAQIDKLFRALHKFGGSDLHLCSETPPQIRLHGEMTPLSVPALPAAQVRQLLVEIIPEHFLEAFEKTGDADFAYELSGVARFRCNVFRDRRGPGGVFRIIPADFLTSEQLGLPQALLNFCTLHKGLVLVTGPTGSGKSTTLTALIDYINRNRRDHIITIEDPIEFVHDNKKCLVNQREVHQHTQSFSRALRAALREDPDIVLVGEMRDLETTHIAIETAETGHLVFGTLHTTTASSTIDRIIDQFPADRQEQVRTMLASSLKGVISQTLCKRKDGKGRIAAMEVLVVTPAVANHIREAKTFLIPSVMQTGAREGMQLLNDAMLKLAIDGKIDGREAISRAIDRPDMLRKLQVAGLIDAPAAEEAKRD